MKNSTLLSRHDLVIIGGGPAGLSAAINAAAEGMKVLLIEHGQSGGQSARSNRVENYYGFPLGVNGEILAARGREQALRLGANMIHADVRKLAKDHESGLFHVWAEVEHKCTRIDSRAVILACGIAARKLDCPGSELSCVRYMPMPSEIHELEQRPVAIIGGGNAAAQAALHAAELGSQVFLIVRGQELNELSSYLKQRIMGSNKIKVIYQAKVPEILQEGPDAQVRFEINGSWSWTLHVYKVFVFIGGSPDMKWLSDDDVAKNDKGFVIVNREFESSLAGLYAIGDCHANARGRIAASVGEGSVVIRSVWEYLNGDSKQSKLARELVYISQQHHAAYADVNGDDESWAIFYAAWLMPLARKLYGSGFNHQCLMRMIQNADTLDKNRANRTSAWPLFYAQYLDEMLTENQKLCAAPFGSIYYQTQDDSTPTPGGNYLERQKEAR